MILLLNILGCVRPGQVGLTSGLTDLASLFFKLGWTRPSHLSWAGTGPARLNRVGLIGGPTYFAFFFFGFASASKIHQLEDVSYFTSYMQIGEGKEKKKLTWCRGCECHHWSGVRTVKVLVAGLLWCRKKKTFVVERRSLWWLSLSLARR